MLVARDNTFDQVDHNIGQITRNHANELSAWVRDKQRVTSSLKNAVDQPEAIAHTMAATAQQAGGFDDAYIVYADKRYIFNHAMPDGFDGPARAWYQQAAQTNGPAITPIYVDAASGKLCMSFVEAVRKDGRVVAAVGTDMLLDSMAKMVAAIQATPKSFAFLLDGQGQILAHPDVKLALAGHRHRSRLDLGQLQQLARNSGSSLTQDIGGVSQLLYASAVEGTPWTLVIAIDRAQANEPVTMMVKLAASITALALLLAVAFVTMAVKRQLRGLPQVQYALQDIASGDGDLTRRLPAEGGDELARIGAAFNQFADKIATILREIRVAADSVRTASLEIASGNHDLSDRTSQQASSLEQTAAAMEEITSTVQHNADNAASRGQPGQRRLARGRPGRRGDAAGGAHHGRHRRLGAQDRRHHRSDRRHRLPDQHPGAERGSGSRARRRTGPRLRRGGRRSAHAGPTQRHRRARDQDADRILGRPDPHRQLAGAPGRRHHGSGGGQRRARDQHRRRDRPGQPEQRTGISEIGNAIGLMDNATQQNAALVEQAAAAAQTLQEQAAHLAQLVGGFKLDSHEVASHSVTRGAPQVAPGPCWR